MADLPNAIAISPHLPLRLQVAKFCFLLVTHPLYLVLHVAMVALAISAVVMLAIGGPVPWMWCALWLAATVWFFWTPIRLLVRDTRVSRTHWVAGTQARSGFGDLAFWIRTENGGRTFPYARTAFAGALFGVVFLRSLGGASAIL